MNLKSTNYTIGLGAEDKASHYLETQAFEVIARRYKTKFGEIDLIARQKKLLCFIEVKIRQNISEALESITPRSQKRIEMAALHFISTHTEYADYDMRFDVIAITRPFEIHHLDNAWQARS